MSVRTLFSAGLAAAVMAVCLAQCGCQRDENGNLVFMKSSPDVPDSAVYFCTKCDYKYNPQFGDPAGQISPRTPFRKLSSDWKCPICGSSKSDFTISR